MTLRGTIAVNADEIATWTATNVGPEQQWVNGEQTYRYLWTYTETTGTKSGETFHQRSQGAAYLAAQILGEVSGFTEDERSEAVGDAMYEASEYV